MDEVIGKTAPSPAADNRPSRRAGPPSLPGRLLAGGREQRTNYCFRRRRERTRRVRHTLSDS